jgi:hypothetical protein
MKLSIMYDRIYNIAYRSGRCLDPVGIRIWLLNNYNGLTFKQATYLTRMFMTWLKCGTGIIQ